MTPERKIIVQRIRSEGKSAYYAGVKLGANPYGSLDYPDAARWHEGWTDSARWDDREPSYADTCPTCKQSLLPT